MDHMVSCQNCVPLWVPFQNTAPNILCTHLGTVVLPTTNIGTWTHSGRVLKSLAEPACAARDPCLMEISQNVVSILKVSSE